MSSLVFRKTDRGKAEIGQRRAGLAPSARQLLILVNGVDSVQALQAKGLGNLRENLDRLLALGLIEPLPAAQPVTASQAAPQAVPTPPSADEDQALLALQRRAYRTLQPQFGPDTPTVAQAMLAARSLADYQRALDGIEAQLAIYMGRKQAAREVQALRHEPTGLRTS